MRGENQFHKDKPKTWVRGALIALGFALICLGLANLYSQKRTRLNLILSTNRLLELEPCGCSLGPSGGLLREANFVEHFRAEHSGETLVLSGGVNFAPRVGSLPISTAQKRLKAQALLKGMALAGNQAVGLVTRDFELGVLEMAQLAEHSQIPFVATNLESTSPFIPFWKEYLRFTRAVYEVLVFSVSAKTSTMPSGLSWKDPVVKIKQILAKLPPRENRLIVLLSSLSELEVEDLIREVPEINVVAGGPEETKPGVIQLARSTLMENTVSEGKQIQTLSFELHQRLRGLYSPQASRLYADFLRTGTEELTELEAKVANSKTDTETKKLERKLFNLKHLLKRAMTVPQIMPKDSDADLGIYQETITQLTNSWEPPIGAFGAIRSLLDSYKRDVRLLAIRDSGGAE